MKAGVTTSDLSTITTDEMTAFTSTSLSLMPSSTANSLTSNQISSLSSTQLNAMLNSESYSGYTGSLKDELKSDASNGLISAASLLSTSLFIPLACLIFLSIFRLN